MKNKWIVCILGLSLLLSGCSTALPWAGEDTASDTAPAETQAVLDTAAPAESAEALPEGITELRFPRSYAWFLGKVDYAPLGASAVTTQAGAYEIDPQFATEAFVEGNQIVLRVTEEQRTALLSQTDALLSQAVDEWLNLNPEYSFESTEDHTAVLFRMDETYSSSDVDSRTKENNLILTIVYMDHAGNILTCASSEASTQVYFVNYHSDNTAAEFAYPAQEIDLTGIDWSFTY